MHLIGPDKLHGFRAQLAYDPHGDIARDPVGAKRLGLSAVGRHPIYPWREGVPTAAGPWPGVVEARAGTTPMIEADDAIEAAALRYLRDPERASRPFALCVGFVAPHFPFVVPELYFSTYWPDATDLPCMPPGHLDSLPPAARRLRQAFGFEGYTEEQVGRARAAYYGLVTYLDDKIGRLLGALEDRELADNTVVIHTSDHGESLGEHGLWRKMNFYEQSARVPLQLSWPRGLPAGRRVSGAVSLVDVTVTILDLAGVPITERPWRMDGESLVPLLRGDSSEWKDEAFAEHLAHGTDRARAMLRRGRSKLCYGHGRPPEIELYDLDSDPGEFTNLADDIDHRAVRDGMLARMMEIWGDPDDVTKQVVSGQEARLLIREVLGDAALF